MMPYLLDDVCFLPVPARQQFCSLKNYVDPVDQIQIFCSLALNRKLDHLHNLPIIALDTMMANEKTFYTCRAVRRLLLGAVSVPCCYTGQRMNMLVHDKPYSGPGLIIYDTSYCISRCITTDCYVNGILSLEESDPIIDSNHENRMVYIPTLVNSQISWPFMFRLVSRYINMQQLDECLHFFLKCLPSTLQHICMYNYSFLTLHLRQPSVQKFPLAKQEFLEQSRMFSIITFLDSWPSNDCIVKLKHKIYENMQSFPEKLQYLFSLATTQPIAIRGSNILAYVEAISFLFPALSIKHLKKEPENAHNIIVVLERPHSKQWVQIPGTNGIMRIALCMANAENVICDRPLQKRSVSIKPVSMARGLVACFEKMVYAPRDVPFFEQLDLCHFQGIPTPEPILKTSFHPIAHISINNFKVNVFNTNMVINTTIKCGKRSTIYQNIINIPKLINNFVIKKFSVKEPSFTVSIFYSSDFSIKAAINVNISGDILNFLFAMNTIKCFLPIEVIYPASISNWNSTLDLHGLENQNLVRNGRRDVFWTTNFPSVVSSKKGFNVSWFKAATATISRLSGERLVQQVKHETALIVGHKEARINFIKNRTFAILESRTGYQVQAIHKRFLECLYECCSWYRLNTMSIFHLSQYGFFDFSKKMIAHSKNKHECALVGYKKCSSIPKLLVNNKKIRIDECGRNANFISYINKTNHEMFSTKQKILRHIIKRARLKRKHFSTLRHLRTWKTF
ncbi:unknown [Porcine lymphotropic herpesvirus 2]|uniref:Herpesvirus UL87 C-terminal domain-containing protein n=1 Tax=Suid gammaherpesvirus 4 TaxID=1960250 RepID=Q8B3W8_9GAMA|nr:unknown [Porcine lymphotropic herpesvirus 2]AAO12366.1 unknown [Porcine lymphotropic herpesvirus 2]